MKKVERLIRAGDWWVGTDADGRVQVAKTPMEVKRKLKEFEFLPPPQKGTLLGKPIIEVDDLDV